ncbi:hypothetical protein HOY34_15265 [Xinfangfangia sp. D13-10-4-6]|uniref:hypothetical protein n=1 Tax=Pseudogemmobacter hezensis TaxID=2737662 RepID=UPI0015575D08|nr:hypothetical protein [Pseudogemmobacter hezensis]NPD16550.1 hypothetical protein [Pseudogemmobacter hezensis]
MRALRARIRAVAALLCIAWSVGAVPPHFARQAEAQMRPGGAARPALVVRSDPGGVLAVRDREVQRLRASGGRVELRGTCNSACTMYLGLDNICIDRRASFGFHGPSSHGRPLPASEFERWSQIMARNYREPLKRWFLDTARHRIDRQIHLSGAELIRLGYPEC